MKKRRNHNMQNKKNFIFKIIKHAIAIDFETRFEKTKTTIDLNVLNISKQLQRL